MGTIASDLARTGGFSSLLIPSRDFTLNNGADDEDGCHIVWETLEHYAWELAAVTGDPSALEGLIAEDAEKRQIAVSRLNQMPGVKCDWPEGTIYAFPDISGTGLTSQAFADRLLEEAGVVVEAGSFYGDTGEGHLRVCFGSASVEDLGTAMDRIQRFVSDLAPVEA